MLAPLALASAVNVLTGLLYAWIGWGLQRRSVEGEARRASLAFGTWWYGIGAGVAIGGARGVAAALGLTDGGPVLAVFVVLHYGEILALCAAVFGILYYLLYLFTGRPGYFWPLLAFYAVYFVAAATLVAQMRPTGVNAGKWFASMTYDGTAGQLPLAILLLLLLLPQIVAAGAYGSLWFRLEDRTQRFRVGIVSIALLLWLGSALVAPLLQLGRFEWWQLGGRFVGLAAAIAIWLAYHPPTSLRRRFGLRGVEEETRA